MDIGKIIKQTFHLPAQQDKQGSTHPKPQNTFLQDIYFTANFHAKAAACGLSEEHARLVYYEGDTVKGKENMKVMQYKGEEIGIYVFHDRLTNQPVVTAIWKRHPRSGTPPKAKTGR